MINWIGVLVEDRALRYQVCNTLDQCGSNDNYTTVIGTAAFSSIRGQIKAYFENQGSQVQL